MTNKQLRRRLREAVERSAPADFGAVLSRLPERKGTVTPMTTTTAKKKRPALRALMAACLALVLLAGAGGGVLYYQSNAVASVVSLDINPSIELAVNRREKVLSCTPMNDEARAVLADMDGGRDLEGTGLSVAVNAIVGALLREGYLQSISSAILISVEDEDASRAAQLQRELTATVDAALLSSSSQASVLSQTLSQDSQLTEQAHASNISTGKAYLVERAINLNGNLAFDALAALSIDELQDLIETGAPGMPIGREAALAAALACAGLTESEVYFYEVDSELDEYTPCYEVELQTAYGEFTYLVDGFSGAVLHGQPDLADFSAQTGTAGSDADIGQDAALAAALKHAGLSESEITLIHAEREWDNGRLEYEIDFYTRDAEYDYTVAAADGAVLKSEREAFATAPQTDTTGTTGGADIGQDAALAAALKHAGLSESEITLIHAEREWDDGRLEYEIDFYTASAEYDYTVAAADGAMLKSER